MLKKILNLEGAQQLSKEELKKVKGGIACDSYDGYCPGTSYCDSGPLNGIWTGRCI